MNGVLYYVVNIFYFMSVDAHVNTEGAKCI